MVQDRRPVRRELRAKVVYWGPSGSGATTNLDVLRKRSPKARRGELTTIATRPHEVDAGAESNPDQRLCSGAFEFMTLAVGRVRGAVVRLDLFTAPSCDQCEETRRLVLHGADAVVFVADSAGARADANKRSLAMLIEALRAAGRDPATFPIVFQWNKRELPGALPAAVLERTLNKVGGPTVHAAARLGEGVLETLRVAARAALRSKDRAPSEERAPLVAITPFEVRPSSRAVTAIAASVEPIGLAPEKKRAKKSARLATTSEAELHVARKARAERKRLEAEQAARKAKKRARSRRRKAAESHAGELVGV